MNYCLLYNFIRRGKRELCSLTRFFDLSIITSTRDILLFRTNLQNNKPNLSSNQAVNYSDKEVLKIIDCLQISQQIQCIRTDFLKIKGWS